MDVKTGKNHDKPDHIESRRKFYDWLAAEIKVPDATASRATEYDDERLRNGGIRLTYETMTEELAGVKPGILLEVGFDDTTPNKAVDISSWAMESARVSNVDVIDNRALGILCYNPEFTFVEKLQTICERFSSCFVLCHSCLTLNDLWVSVPTTGCYFPGGNALPFALPKLSINRKI